SVHAVLAVERGADHRVGLAGGVWVGTGPRCVRGQRGQHAVFAVDGVRGRQQLAGRVAPQDVLAPAGGQVVGRVRLAAAKLPHGERAAKSLDVLREIALERADVEAVDVADFGGALDHRASSIPSRDPRYTPGP